MSYATRYKSSVTIKNNKAFHDYTIVEKEIAGILLTGTEIKSIRNGSANLKDSYIIIRNGEANIINMHITNYDKEQLCCSILLWRL